MTTVSQHTAKVALVHYWLVNRNGGGERVIEALCELFPQADIFTHCVDPTKLSHTLEQHTIKTTFINRMPFSKRFYKHYLPLMPLALEQVDLSEYDLVISSESGPAKGIIAPATTKHICYCHTPMRYLWDHKDAYLAEANPLIRLFMIPIFHYLRLWDVLSAKRADAIVANSSAVAARIKRWWGCEAEVIPPPVDTEYFKTFINEEPGDYYLFAGRLVRYKRADLAIKACEQLGKRLVVVGQGEEMKALKSMAGPKVEFRGEVEREELARLYAGCQALLFPGEEDFGIVPIETMAAGRPVIAYARGGALDYITDKNGLFFNQDTPESLAKAILRFEADLTFDPITISAQASRFGRDHFKGAFMAAISRVSKG
ncbi:glycosyltransferase [Pseudodesulfovibrio methanolicus]|uniref:Glycosyltransferase n=1 Tax=Pseudodesulfovibrio methanolicus TaxID=3126690 RepID=A0ABZ2ITK9_9BACT